MDALVQSDYQTETEANRPIVGRREKLRHAVDHAAHLLPKQGPIGVFVHHNTLHAFEGLPFEQALLQTWDLFGAEPYMMEAAYRAELARGRIHLEDIDAVLDSEPDALVFPRLRRRSLRRAMMTPGVREFDAATILWRAEQGDWPEIFAAPRCAVCSMLACFAQWPMKRSRKREAWWTR